MNARAMESNGETLRSSLEKEIKVKSVMEFSATANHQQLQG
jgi:hypothetical protein